MSNLRLDPVHQHSKNYSEWYLEETILDTYYAGGAIHFYDDFLSIMKYPKPARELCSQAIVLFELKLLPDTVTVKFNDFYGLQYENEIENALRQIQNNWHHIPQNGVQFKMNINFRYKSSKNEFESWYPDSQLISVVESKSGGIVDDPSYCDSCLFCNNSQILERIEYYKMKGNMDSAAIFYNEIKRRDPLGYYIINE